jgi:hypothetical protein
MLRKMMLILFLLVLSLTAVLPVRADAPAEGLVIEGESVPGIALGFTRAQVEAVYGEPQSCQSGAVGGDFAHCSFPVEGGGQVDVNYRGPDGGNPSNSPDDVVHYIYWTEQVSGWTTTAGVNTALAKADPEAVVAAYPNAQLTYDMFGNLIRVEDARMGIKVSWNLEYLSGTYLVSMQIFHPREPAPPREKLTRVTDIDLVVYKHRGRRQVRAYVRVQDDRTLAASGATVFATWTFPDGSTQPVQDVTSGAGGAYFEINEARRGTYTLTVDDVLLDDHQFDRDSSVLSASIRVK